jgi:transposase
MRLQRSRLTDEQTERLLECFVAGTPARQAAGLTRVNRNTARLFYFRLRELIAKRLDEIGPVTGEIEIDDSDVAHLHHGERRRAPHGETPLFGLLVRGDKVHSVTLSRAGRETQSAQRARVRVDAIVYSGALEFSAEPDFDEIRRGRPAGGDDAVAAQEPLEIDTIKNFLDQARRHLRRYNGVPHRHFHLFLKECEWRFNYDGSPEDLLRTLKLWINERSRRSRR